MNKIKAFKYMQEDQLYLSMILPFASVNKISKPLIYNKDNPLGYQRSLDKKHYYELARKLKKGEVTLPTAVVLGISEEVISDFISIRNEIDIENELIDFPIDDFVKSNEPMFSVVDGQHRLAALELASSKKPDLLDFNLNVIVLINKDINRIREVKVFTDINSKAKRITTDLTLLAEYNYRLYYSPNLTEQDFLEHIGVNIAYKLNEKTEANTINVWFNAIKLDITSDDNYGIIGVSAFKNSITPLIKVFIENKQNKNDDCNDTLNNFDWDEIEEISYDISEFLLKAWYNTFKRWPTTFNSENPTSMFNKDFYIQKTTGVNALHQILTDCIIKNNNTSEALLSYKNIITDSSIQDKQWKVKDIFAGLTSKSGFSKAKKIILGEISKEPL